MSPSVPEPACVSSACPPEAVVTGAVGLRLMRLAKRVRGEDGDGQRRIAPAGEDVQDDGGGADVLVERFLTGDLHSIDPASQNRGQDRKNSGLDATANSRCRHTSRMIRSTSSSSATGTVDFVTTTVDLRRLARSREQPGRHSKGLRGHLRAGRRSDRYENGVRVSDRSGEIGRECQTTVLEVTDNQ